MFWCRVESNQKQRSIQKNNIRFEYFRWTSGQLLTKNVHKKYDAVTDDVTVLEFKSGQEQINDPMFKQGYSLDFLEDHEIVHAVNSCG